jgi:hypothetical protein
MDDASPPLERRLCASTRAAASDLRYSWLDISAVVFGRLRYAAQSTRVIGRVKDKATFRVTICFDESYWKSSPVSDVSRETFLSCLRCYRALQPLTRTLEGAPPHRRKITSGMTIAASRGQRGIRGCYAT